MQRVLPRKDEHKDHPSSVPSISTTHAQVTQTFPSLPCGKSTCSFRNARLSSCSFCFSRPFSRIVTVSFTSKSLITLYLLKSLDGIQKNVGEALAVIVIFLGQILGSSRCVEWRSDANPQGLIRWPRVRRSQLTRRVLKGVSATSPENP